ncbi:MAG: SufE family protein [Bdellovibrionales bacterium]|nr:SufE family protein [Bdellovibrionales bacterium]
MTCRQNEIIASFSQYLTWEEKYRHIIEVGKSMETFPEVYRRDNLKVPGCQSQVWLYAQLEEDGVVKYFADSDALIVKGLVALLLKLFSQATPQQILVTNPDFIHVIELGQHLSPSRSNGLIAMIKQIKYYAAAFKALSEKGLKN